MVNTNIENSESTVDNIINEIKQNSKDGHYIYRGENNKEYCKISSRLYREYFNDEDPNIDLKDFDLRFAQREILYVSSVYIVKVIESMSRFWYAISYENSKDRRNSRPTCCDF